MFVIVGWQMEAESKFHTSIRGTCRAAVRYSYLILLLPVTYYALECFQDKVVLVAPGVSAAESHSVNKDCVFSIYDLHDVWHMLSAIGLALVGMLLLDVKVK